MWQSWFETWRWQCVFFFFPHCRQLNLLPCRWDHLGYVSTALWRRAERMCVYRGEDQPERTESCFRALLANVCTVWLKMCHPDLLSVPTLCPRPNVCPRRLFRIWPENPQYPWKCCFIIASSAKVVLAPNRRQKTARAASQEVFFWNLVVPVWEGKKKNPFRFFFPLFCCIKRASACFREFKSFCFLLKSNCFR